MKPGTIFNSLILIALALSSIEAFAYNDDKEKEICRHPKVQEFTLPEYKAPDNTEVKPEAEFSFVVSGWANPKKFSLDAKGIAIPFTVKSTDTFHKVNAKLPADLTGKSVRINARIPALLGCYTTVGWLIKVADKPIAASAAVPAANTAATPTNQDSTTPTPQNVVPVPETPAEPVVPTLPKAPASSDVITH